MRFHRAWRALGRLGTPPRPLRLASAVVAVFLATAALAQPQERADESDTLRAPLLSERREPWPLRPDPLPGLEGSRCPAGAHYLFRVGGLVLRLGPGIRWSATPVERRPPTWMWDLPGCGEGRSIHVRQLELDLASVTGLPQDCWATGVAPGPDGPACASTPEGLRAGRRFFALGLPGDIGFVEQPATATPAEDEARLRAYKAIVRRTPLGNEEVRAPVPSRPGSDGGWPTYLLPRAGEGAEALGPLLVDCFTGRWPNPDGPGRVAASHVCAARPVSG